MATHGSKSLLLLYVLTGLRCYSYSGACPGGAQGAWAPPPLEIEKQKKKKRSSEQILSYFTYILLLFSRKYHFLRYFLSWDPPPPEKLKSKKKRSSEQILSYFTYILLLFPSKISFSPLFSELGPPLKNYFGPPPPYKFLDTRLLLLDYIAIATHGST